MLCNYCINLVDFGSDLLRDWKIFHIDINSTFKRLWPGQDGLPGGQWTCSNSNNSLDPCEAFKTGQQLIFVCAEDTDEARNLSPSTTQNNVLAQIGNHIHITHWIHMKHVKEVSSK
jgi:hypothetical protein